jgi:hypothetical protein
MPVSRTLVVGTTPDYVDIIRRRFHDRALFLVDSESIHWSGRSEFAPDEIPSDLSDYKGSLAAVRSYAAIDSIAISGVVCYDCESLCLSA